MFKTYIHSDPTTDIHYMCILMMKAVTCAVSGGCQYCAASADEGDGDCFRRDQKTTKLWT